MRSLYIFERSNQKFINLLATYNRDCTITALSLGAGALRMSNIPPGLTCARLSELIDSTKFIGSAGKAHLMCDSKPNVSTIGLLPPFDSQLFSQLISHAPVNEQSVATIMSVLSIISINISSVLFNANLSSASKYKDVLFQPAQITIDQQQAFLMLQRINERFPIAGAILFESDQLILLQIQSSNFILHYGDKFEFNSVGFDFDLDVGALNGPPRLLELINAHFSKWKASGYLGKLFPDQLMLGQDRPHEQTEYAAPSRVAPAAAYFQQQNPTPIAPTQEPLSQLSSLKLADSEFSSAPSKS